MRRPALLVREGLVLTLAVPLVTLLVIRLLSVSPPSSVVFALLAICPAAPDVLYGFRRRGSAAPKALAVVGVALATSVLFVPAWRALERYKGYDLRLSPVQLATILVLKAFLPLGLGTLVGRLWRRFATTVAPILDIAVLVALVVSELLLLRVGADTLRLVTLRLAVAAVLITAACAVLGRLAGGRDSELGEILVRGSGERESFARARGDRRERSDAEDRWRGGRLPPGSRGRDRSRPPPDQATPTCLRESLVAAAASLGPPVRPARHERRSTR